MRKQYAKIPATFWERTKTLFSVEEKYIMLYLLTNKQKKFDSSVASDETWFPEASLLKILRKLESYKLIKFSEEDGSVNIDGLIEMLV